MRLLFSLLCLTVVPGFSASKEGSLPLFFIQNPGVADAAVRYLVETPTLKAAYSGDSVTFRVHGEEIALRFQGANRRTTLEGIDPLAAKANFFFGSNALQWHSSVPTFQKILYRNLYPEIDLTYAGTEDRIKSEFTQ